MSLTPDAFDSRFFRTVLGHFPTGVTVITADPHDGGPVGVTIGSFTSVSLDPPLVAFLPATSSESWPAIEAAGAFCVNILAEHQAELCGRFAGKDPDKFAGVPWTPAPVTGSPVLEETLGWIDCEIDAAHEAGDHLIVVGRVVALAAIETERGPLLFRRGAYGRFGAI